MRLCIFISKQMWNVFTILSPPYRWACGSRTTYLLLIFDTSYTDIDCSNFRECYLTDTNEDAMEAIPHNISLPRSKGVKLCMFMDSNHVGNKQKNNLGMSSWCILICHKLFGTQRSSLPQRHPYLGQILLPRKLEWMQWMSSDINWGWLAFIYLTQYTFTE